MQHTLLTLLTKTQDELFKYLCDKLFDLGYQEIIETSEVIYAQGDSNMPCLVAHLDTINTHRSPYNNRTTTKTIHHKEIAPTEDDIIITKDICTLHPEADYGLSCLGADDRVGVLSVLEMLERGHRPHVLFTTDEEIGCVGTQSFLREYGSNPQYREDFAGLEEVTMFIQVDRGVHEGSWNEMVFYDYDETSIPEIYEELAKNYTLALGSFTDVALLGEYFDTPLVNLSASYKNEHTRDEYIRLDWLETNLNSLDEFITWISNQDTTDWVYTPNRTSYYNSYNYFNDGHIDEIYEIDLDYLKEIVQEVYTGVDNPVKHLESHLESLEPIDKYWCSLYLDNAHQLGMTVGSLLELDSILTGDY